MRRPNARRRWRARRPRARRRRARRPRACRRRGGQGAPAKIASGSSGEDASLAREDDFESKEEDDEHNQDDGLAGEARFAHDKIAVEARFALGFWPSDKARAAAARLSDAEVVRGAVAALRHSSSASAAQATIGNDVKVDERSKAGANWHAKQGDPKDDAGGATKQETHRTRGPQVLTADEETNVRTTWQANQGSDPSKQVGWAAKRSADHKSVAQAAAQRKSNHVAHRGRWEAQPPSVDSVVWHYRGNSGENRTARKRCQFFPGPQNRRRSPSVNGVVWHNRGNPGENRTARKCCQFFLVPGEAKDPGVLTELFGTTAGTQRRTGQRVSASNFSLASGTAGAPQVSTELFGPSVPRSAARQAKSSSNEHGPHGSKVWPCSLTGAVWHCRAKTPEECGEPERPCFLKL